MVKQQKITRDSPKKHTIIINDKTPKVPQLPDFDPAIANQPVRMINFVEVGDMDAKQVQFMIQELNKTYSSAKGGIHYFLPVRHGKIGTDVVFEKEWEDVVNKTCEVNEDGKIVIKGGAKDVAVIRQHL